jgi:hypothetical protein
LLACCTRITVTPPIPIALQPAPIEITAAEIYQDYTVNPASADAGFRFKRVMFTNLVVENVHGRIYVQTHGELVYLQDWFTSGNVMFIDLQDYLVAMQHIKVGYILNIVGTCEGLEGGYVTVDNCWVQSVQGDLGIGSPPVQLYGSSPSD